MILAIDSSAGASVAVLEGDQVRGAWRTEATTTHAEVLAPAVRELLTEVGLDPVAPTGLEAVVVGVGPGPFTGLRAGMVLAHTLAEVWSLPLHGVCSLDSLALRALDHGLVSPGAEFQVAVDARRREVYSARYAVAHAASGEQTTHPTRLGGPEVGPADVLAGSPTVGLGAQLYPDSLTPVEGAQAWSADAVELGRLAADPAHRVPVRPMYLRESDAKVPGPRKRAGA